MRDDLNCNTVERSDCESFVIAGLINGALLEQVLEKEKNVDRGDSRNVNKFTRLWWREKRKSLILDCAHGV